jgi:hypothetical protein
MANAPDPEPETSDDSDASYDSHHMQCPRCGVTESSDHFEYIPYYIDHPNAVFPNDNLENDRDFCTHCATIVENTLGETRNYCEDNPDCVDCAAARAEQEQAVAAEAALLNGGSVTHFAAPPHILEFFNCIYGPDSSWSWILDTHGRTRLPLYSYRGFKPKGGGIRIITFRVTTKLQSKSNRCIWHTTIII